MITAKEWNRMETVDLLQSLEIAASVLKNRPLTREQIRYVVEIVKDLLEVVE